MQRGILRYIHFFHQRNILVCSEVCTVRRKNPNKQKQNWHKLLYGIKRKTYSDLTVNDRHIVRLEQLDLIVQSRRKNAVLVNLEKGLEKVLLNKHVSTRCRFICIRNKVNRLQKVSLYFFCVSVTGRHVMTHRQHKWRCKSIGH